MQDTTSILHLSFTWFFRTVQVPACPIGSSTWGTSACVVGVVVEKIWHNLGFKKPPPTWHSNLQGAWSPKRISAVRLARCKGLTTNSSGEALWFRRLIQGDVAVNLQWCRVDIEFPSTLIHKPSIYYNLWSQFFLHHYIHIIRTYNVDQYLQDSIRFTFGKSAIEKQVFFDSPTTCPAPPAEGTRQRRSAPPANSSMLSLPTSLSHPLECYMIPKDLGLDLHKHWITLNHQHHWIQCPKLPAGSAFPTVKEPRAAAKSLRIACPIHIHCLQGQHYTKNSHTFWITTGGGVTSPHLHILQLPRESSIVADCWCCLMLRRLKKWCIGCLNSLNI